jgi:hypothetical protein
MIRKVGCGRRRSMNNTVSDQEWANGGGVKRLVVVKGKSPISWADSANMTGQKSMFWENVPVLWTRKMWIEEVVGGSSQRRKIDFYKSNEVPLIQEGCVFEERPKTLHSKYSKWTARMNRKLSSDRYEVWITKNRNWKNSGLVYCTGVIKYAVLLVCYSCASVAVMLH